MSTKEQYKERVAHLEDDLHNLEVYMEEFTNFLPVGVCILNSEQIIVDTNEVFADITGYQSSAATGMVLGDLFTEPERLESLLTAVSGNPGSTQQTKLTLEHAGGQTQTVRVIAAVRTDINDSPTGFFVSIMELDSATPPAPAPASKPPTTPPDSDKLAQLQKRLAHETAKLQAITDGIQDGVMAVDENEQIVTVNRRVAGLIEVDRDDLIGVELEQLSHQPLSQPLHEVLSRNPSEPEEVTISGERFTAEVHSGTTDRGDSYKVLILHDISRDEWIEDMKLTFVSVAAHQIRTPLSSIRWSFEILAKQLKDEENQQIARRGYQSTQNMLEIVNELLNLDRLQSGESGYSFGPVDITELIADYVEEVRSHSQILDQPKIDFSPPADPLPKVRADQEKLRIVLRNLIDNALKYTDSDGSVKITSSVHVSGDYGNDMVEIAIADTGIGIPEPAQEKIFSKFYRADNATSMQTDGTGIGLYITKRIIEAHNGTIRFESEPGEGTTFFVQLPIAQTQS